MKILVLGASGMMGHVIATYLKEKNHDVQTLSMSTPLDSDTVMLDIMQKQKLEDYLDSSEFNAVINAAGVLIEQSEKEKDVAVYMNAYLPHLLEKRYEGTKTKVVQLSTDCVFSGKNGPYKEDSRYDGELYYDRTKAIGEVFNDKDLTFRMSTVGPEIQQDGVGLFNWFMKQEGQISGYTDAIWSGVTTLELAKGIGEAIKQDLKGLYHFVPAKSISKFDLLTLFKDVFENKKVQINPLEGGGQKDKTLLNSRKDFAYTVPDYPEMIVEMRDWINNHKDLYNY